MFPTQQHNAAIVTDPAIAARLPAAAQSAWLALKEARGTPIDADRLFRLEAMPSTYPAPGDRPLVAQLDAARSRTRATVRALIGRPTGGDAA